MSLRRHLAFVIVAVLPCLGASYRTTNFVVDAPTPQAAQQVGQLAEQYRKEKALLWLGREMPPWPEPCPLKVKITMNGAGGATSFAFDNGQVLGQHMNIEGSLERLLASVLPHEVTHTVFAHYFRCPVPRWADEGGAVLSEDDIERNRHDMLVRQILNTPGRAMPLRRLFALREYPSDVMILYAEGFSVSQFLVERSNRQDFLAFVAQGMQEGWDNAARSHYRFNNVEELEQAWLAHLRATKHAPAQLARNTGPNGPQDGQMMARQTVPPNQPTLAPPAPVFRGQSPGQEEERYGDSARNTASGRLGYLPGFPAPPDAAPIQPAPQSGSSRDPWKPAAVRNTAPSVRLGQPQFCAPVPALPPPPQPADNFSPIGYPQ